MPLNEYPSGTAFPGVIGRTADESTPAWPAPVRASTDAPNVLLSDPFIVSWPKRIAAKGDVREQYAHCIDMVPTVLDVPGIEPPATIRGVARSPLRMPVDGSGLARFASEKPLIGAELKLHMARQ